MSAWSMDDRGSHSYETSQRIQARVRDMEDRGYGWPMRGARSGGWWRDEPLPVSVHVPDPDAPAKRAAERWRSFVEAGRALAAEMWEQGDKAAALRAACAAGIFGLNGSVPVRAVWWCRSTPLRRSVPLPADVVLRCGSVVMRWQREDVHAELTGRIYSA